MDERLVGALAIARGADLWIRIISDQPAIRMDGPIMEVGRGADPNVIVTLGCRRQLALRGVHDEAHVLQLVERYGYSYVPQSWTIAARLAS